MENHNTRCNLLEDRSPNLVDIPGRTRRISEVWRWSWNVGPARRAHDANGTARIRNDLVDKHTHTNRKIRFQSLIARPNHNSFTFGVHT